MGIHVPGAALLRVIEVLLAAGVVVLASLLVGAVACRLCGIRRWTWLSGPVGLSLIMLLSVPSLHAPGRMAFAAVVTLLISIAGIVLLVRDPALRPPVWAPLALLPTLVLACVPFMANARAGTLGVGFNNDMAAHMLLTDGLRSSSIASFNTILNWYPLGPHATVGALTAGLGLPTDLAFAGLTVALPLLAAGLALEILRPLHVPARILGATLVAVPYLATSYFVEGAFKELVMIVLTLGVVAAIPLAREGTDLRRFVPVAVILAGTVGAYGYPGLAWPVGALGLWFVATAVLSWREHGWRHVAARVRGILPAAGVGVGATVVLLLPQAVRVKRFYDWNAATGIRKDDIGNLAGPISPGEALGVWLQPDFRFDPVDWTPTALWLVVVGAALAFALVWWARRRDLAAPAALGAAVLIWAASDQSQSPYVVAKALAIASPFVLLLIAGALLAPRPKALATWRRAVPVVAGLAIAGAALWSSFGALRNGQVGDRTHQSSLQSVRAVVRGEPTLFLGIDDFIKQELPDVPVTQPLLGALALPLRPEKQWAYGQPFDFDSFTPDVLDTFTYVVTPRDVSASHPPANFTLAARRGAFDVYRRTGPTPARSILAEVGSGAAVLDCTTPEGRALARRGGTAALHPPTVVVPLTPMASGATQRVALPLTPGTWDLTVRYVSSRPITVVAPGLRTQLPPAMERPGPGWPAGSVRTTAAGSVPVTFTADRPLLAPDDVPVVGVVALLATRRAPERLVPMRKACGRSVDWYRPAS